MKKFSVILLVAILAMACVFADPVTIDATINGTATASYKVGLKDGSLDYATTGLVPVKPNTSNFKITLNAVTKKSAASEVYGLLGAKLELVDFTKANVTLTDLAIVKTDAWKINFLGGELAGLASSPIVATTNNILKATASKLTSKGTGIEFTWNLNAKQAFTFIGAAERLTGTTDKVGTYVLAAKTPVFVLVEGNEAGVNALDIQGVGGFTYSDANGWYFAGSVGMNSKTNVAKVAVAADNEITVKDSKVTYNMEAKLDASFAPVAKDAAGKDVYFADLMMYTYKKAAERLVLDAKTTFRTYPFSPCTPVVVNVKCMNILAESNDARNLSADANVTIAKNYVVGAYANNVLYNGATVGTTSSRELGVTGSITVGDPKLVDATYGIVNEAKVYYATGDKKIGYKLGATYNDGWFDKATLSIENSFVCEKGGAKSLVITASAETSSLVDNAVLSLSYDGGNLLKKTVGSVTAACEISF